MTKTMMHVLLLVLSYLAAALSLAQAQGAASTPGGLTKLIPVETECATIAATSSGTVYTGGVSYLNDTTEGYGINGCSYQEISEMVDGDRNSCFISNPSYQNENYL